MERRTLVSILGAVAIVAAVVAVIWTSGKKYHLVLTGDILKVRTHGIDNENAIAIVDFRLHNPTAVRCVVKDVKATLDTANGQTLDGDSVSEIDARRLFEYYPAIGQKYNPTLMIRAKIDPGQTIDRMLAVSFKTSAQGIEQRKGLHIQILDADGQLIVIPPPAK